MCGRIAQYGSKQQYANEIGWVEYARSLNMAGNNTPQLIIPITLD